MKAIGADTKKQEVAPNAYLPGGVISALRGKAKLLIVEESAYKGRLGNLLAVKLSIYNKTIAIINMYRIPASTSNRNKCSLTQYNLIDGKAKKLMQYRKEILVEIKKYIQDSHNIDEIILAGNFNQDITSNKIQ